tara:strand:- start:1365 stop:1619 length:255 start_codon:yes stop_codon:yes gene_type:complete
MSIFKNNKEENTAKDSKIEELTHEVKHLREKYLETLQEYSELLRESKKLVHDLNMLKIELSSYDTREEKKSLNLNKTYDGIHKY